MSYQNVNVNNITTSEITHEPVPTKKPFFAAFTEDIWAVTIGGFVIIAILLLTTLVTGFKLQLPVYQWANTSELTDKVLSFKNMLLILQTWLIILVLSGTAIGLSGGSMKNFAAGFSLIYVLAIIAQVIAGNKLVDYYGLEYVIFALVL
ncbi:MAG: hypothetical protein ACJ751_00355, partial [Niastella sp.]|uniref:hypothetical protein n=1 Tax=Niastella sp. TaxID=1869183 RepID=UPI00389A905E